MTTESAVVLDFLPFYHIYGMMVLLNCGLAAGATQIILPRFDPEAALALIQEHRVTDLYCVPPVVLALVNQPRLDEFDLSSLRFLMSGAAPLPAEVGRQAAEKLGCIVMQGYGMTEASPITNVNPLASPRDGHGRAAGRRHAREGREPRRPARSCRRARSASCWSTGRR